METIARVLAALWPALMLAAIILAIVFFSTEGFTANGRWSSIGGTLVPAGLICAEDEVIAFDGPDHLTCVHVENTSR